jgi:hypothetical protein
MNLDPHDPDLRQLAAAAIADLEAEERAKHSRLNEDDLRLVDQMRVRFAGFTAQGERMIDVTPDLLRIQQLTAYYTKWVTDLQAAVANARQDPQRRAATSGLTPEMREVMDRYAIQGGLSTSYSTEKLQYILDNGFIVLVELEVREKLILIGLNSCLSRTPWSTAEAPENPFAKFGFEDVIAGRGQDDRAIFNLAEDGLYACQTAVVPNTNCKVVSEQLQHEGVELPDDKKDKNMLRLGVASLAKYAAYAVASAERMGNEYATSDIGGLQWRDEADSLFNGPGFGINGWMKLVGRHGHPAIQFDPDDASVSGPRDKKPSQASLWFHAHGGKLINGIATLKHTLASKGHPMARIEQEIRTFTRSMQKSIADGSHLPW